MPDLSAALPTTDLEEAFLRIVDVEGKLTNALEDLGPISRSRVLLLDSGRGHRARQLAEIGAQVTTVTFADDRDPSDAVERLARLPEGEADVVVAAWSELAVPGTDFVPALDRLLRPGGRILVVHDYGRDDVWGLWPDRQERQILWSQRRGPFLQEGFRIRVIHCWWTFPSLIEAKRLLIAGFGAEGARLATEMRKVRLEYQVAIYHRSKPLNSRSLEDEGAAEPPVSAQE
jgi:hypothetical protein